jgi:DNA polymerase III sliding clamp (beta) subunit (PCNA family)
MEIRKEDLSVVEAAAKNDISPVLRNVYVQPGSLVACDGRILVTRVVPMEKDEQPFEPFLVDARALKAAANGGGFLRAGENGKAVFLAATGNNGTLVPNGTETTLEKGDSSYPEYGRVIPAENREGQRTALIDPAYMARLFKAFKGVESVRISILDEDSAIRFDGETPDGRKGVGARMPLVQR